MEMKLRFEFKVTLYLANSDFQDSVKDALWLNANCRRA
jgi:hypothetical protein